MAGAARLDAVAARLPARPDPPPRCALAPGRRRWALPLQLWTTLADAAPYADAVCRRPALALPKLQPLLHGAARVLHLATFLLSPMLPVRAAPPDTSADCASLMIFLQLCALALPAIYKARQEERLFALHQWQRAQRGLAPEPRRGLHARVYTAVAALPPAHKSEVLWTGVLLIVLWHAALLLQQHGQLPL